MKLFGSSYLLLLIALLLPSFLWAQKVEKRFATAADVTSDSATRKIFTQSCNQIPSYIPDTLYPEFTPFRKVRINVHIIQDGKGQNNFSEAEGKKFVEDMVGAANWRVQNNEKMNLPVGNKTPVLKPPFMFVLTGDPKNPGDDGIYFHRDDTLFCMNKKANGKQVNNVYDPRQFKKYGVQRDTVINIFLIEHCPDSIKSPTYKASNDGVGYPAWAKVVACYNLWKHPQITSNHDTIRFGSWDASALLLHELGHSLGLQHTWNMDDGCEDTPKNGGCWNYNEPAGCTEVSNNVMDYNAYKSSLTPCQIGKIFRGFYDDKGSRKYLLPDWCNYDAGKSVTIRRGDEIKWNGSMDIYGDLIVEDNATLTIVCTLSIPPGGKIILMPGATLIIDGGRITSRCSGQFEGIEIWSKKNKKPAIHLMHKAIIDNVAHPL